MGNGRGSELTSGFDALLAHNRQQFDSLLGGRRRSGAPAPAAPVARENPVPASDAAALPSVQALDARFGDGWRYEVTERRHDGDEVTVACRLTVPGHGPAVTCRGRASRDGSRITGRVGDIPFSAGTAWPRGDSDAAAWQAATDQALAACLEQIGD